jgi:hypothetical protein
MKIVSNFKDYYDGTQTYGVNEKTAWFHSIKLPLFIFLGYAYVAHAISLDWSEDILSSPEEIMVNPNLQQPGFQLVKDTSSGFQEINQFISGVTKTNQIHQSIRNVLSTVLILFMGLEPDPKRKNHNNYGILYQLSSY